MHPPARHGRLGRNFTSYPAAPATLRTVPALPPALASHHLGPSLPCPAPSRANSYLSLTRMAYSDSDCRGTRAQLLLNDVLDVAAETAGFTGRQELLRWLENNQLAELQWADVVRRIGVHFGGQSAPAVPPMPPPMPVGGAGRGGLPVPAVERAPFGGMGLGGLGGGEYGISPESMTVAQQVRLRPGASGLENQTLCVASRIVADLRIVAYGRAFSLRVSLSLSLRVSFSIFFACRRGRALSRTGSSTSLRVSLRMFA